jgi:uncharacterized protein
LVLEIKNIHKDAKINIQGGLVLDGFPSTGLVNAIASECLIRSIGTELIAVVDSPEFPPVSIIENYVPQFPARIYLNEKLKVAFFISEVNMGASMEKVIAEMILKWALQNECRMIVSSSGIVIDSEEGNGKQGLSEQDRNNEQGMRSQLMAITSTSSAAKIAEANGFIRFKNGTVTGIPAILLNEGALTNFDVIVFLTEMLKDVPDFHAAAVISEAVTKLIPGLSCDLASLMVEAQSAQSHINNIINNHNQQRLPYY